MAGTTPDLNSLLSHSSVDLPLSFNRLDSSSLAAAPPSDSIRCYNPSDPSSWIEYTMFFPTQPVLPPPPTSLDPLIPPYSCSDTGSHQPDESSGIQLVHLLVSCADCVHRQDSTSALSLIEQMRPILFRLGTSVGFGKVASHFLHALTLRLLSPKFNGFNSNPPTPSEFLLYHGFYEACPHLKFAHFTANQAILEAFHGRNRVHVVDLGLMHGLQWPALIHALALRPGGPPFLRLTGIGPPSLDGRDPLRDVGTRLADLARSVGVRFAFHGVAADRLEHVQPWMLEHQDEAVAVNSIFQLHRLLTDHSRVDSVLGWIGKLRPEIVTVVELEADHNRDGFLDRFTEALFYYSTTFDSLDECGAGGGQQAALAEAYLRREICNILCCEGEQRVERHEPLARWMVRMGRAGFVLRHLGSNALKQATMLLSLFSGHGYCAGDVDGCLTLGWHSRPLIAASAWRHVTGELGGDGTTAGNSNTSCSGSDDQRY